MPREQQQWFQLTRQRHLSGGSGNSSSPAVETALANNLNSETSIANTEFQQSQANVAKMAQEEAPAISLYTGLTSGNPNSQMTAAAPIIGQIQSGYTASKESIMNSIPPGPARDYALSQLNVQQNSQTSGTIANITNNAFGQLASLGQSTGAFGLQQLGAGLNAYSGATQTAQPILQSNAQQKSSTMGFLGQLVGGAADVASGGIFGTLAGGAASAAGGGGVDQALFG